MTDQKTLEKYQKMMSAKAEMPLANSIIGLLGAQNSGKTATACTISDFCPAELPAVKLTDLDDVCVIAVEDGGVDALVPLKLRVKNVVPFGAIMSDVKHPVQAFDVALDLAKASGATKLVIDSLSQWDTLLQGWLSTTEGELVWGGDKFKKYAYSLGAHQVVLSKLKEFQGIKIINLLPQAVFDDLKVDGTEKAGVAIAMDKGMERRDKALGAISQADLIPSLTGKARELWTRDLSLLLALQQVKQKDGSYAREMLTQFEDKSGLACKSRFGSILNPREEMHLGKLVKKIRAFA